MPTDPAALTPEDFLRETGVSRETLDRLQAYWGLLEKWQKSINLVGPSTLGDPWRRHLLDSAQLAPLVPRGTHRLIDMGSGAGFPGMVLAIMGVAEHVTLIDSDQRKSVFLREAARITGTRLTVQVGRLERIDVQKADVITARALAPLDKLVQYAQRLVAENNTVLFLKGQDIENELTRLPNNMYRTARTCSSLTDKSGSILVLEGLSG